MTKLFSQCELVQSIDGKEYSMPMIGKYPNKTCSAFPFEHQPHWQFALLVLAGIRDDPIMKVSKQKNTSSPSSFTGKPSEIGSLCLLSDTTAQSNHDKLFFDTKPPPQIDTK